MAVQRSLAQRRAHSAWNNVQVVLRRAGELRGAKASREADEAKKTEDPAESWRKKYGTLARRAPGLILANGLGHTLAFVRSKRDHKEGHQNPHDLFYQHLSTWVIAEIGATSAGQSLLEWIIDPDRSSADYRRATLEALSYLVWLKRFAEAELPEEEER
jgi:CRISPR-associated protein Cmr5